ncbi:anaerobic ribonucleoside-triphosphate reductase activating protein [Bacteroidales bacterium OttesenSCG-928-J19]|nr:anaerobic ribonucleoside-triphosphate reductase activating protein [Bacteroidales bacterium OttesenSCG-928-J19]
MLKYQSYDIVFQEVPGEITLAINIANCPNHCRGCHSTHLWEDRGEPLNEGSLLALLNLYGNAITCICFMGGDNEPREVERLSLFVRKETKEKLKTAWYSGKSKLSAEVSCSSFHYIKIGSYIPTFGGLDSPDTNQRFYRISNDGKMIDETVRFKKKGVLV